MENIRNTSLIQKFITLRKHQFKKIAAVQVMAKRLMVNIKNLSILNNLKQLKPFTMKVKSTSTILAFFSASFSGLQTANAQTGSWKKWL
jgi:hypothetical protein